MTPRVVIGGGGVAGIESALALRDLAGEMKLAARRPVLTKTLNRTRRHLSVNGADFRHRLGWIGLVRF